MNTHPRKPLPSEATPYQDEIAEPLVITALHVQDVETSTVAGAPRAWRKMSTLEHAYKQERLGAIDSNDARNRLAAGNQYTELWDCAQKAGRDSTALFDAGRSMGSGTPLGEHQRDAIERLVRIEMHLGRNDRTIVRGVCAYGHSPSEAMTLAGLSIDTRATARLCEALDALADAIDRTERRGRK